MDENNIVQDEQIQSADEPIMIYSRKKKYIGLILCMTFIFVVGTNLFNNISKKNEAKDTYEEYYDEVYDFLEDTHKKYEKANSSEKEHDSEYEDGAGYQKAADFFFDMLTLGEYSASDPTKYEEEKDYLLHMANSEYHEFMSASPKYVIAKGIINNWDEDKTVKEIMNDRNESQLFSNSLSLEIFSFILSFAFFTPVSILLVYSVKRRAGYVNIIGDTLQMNGEAPINISNITDIKTKPLFGTLCIQTNEKVYKRHHIAYVDDFAEVIRDLQNYDIDSEEEQ